MTERHKHPGIASREGPAGVEAAIPGRRLFVWQVVETVWASDGSVDEAAAFLGILANQVEAAMRYYADFPDAIDAAIAANKEASDRLQVHL